MSINNNESANNLSNGLRAGTTGVNLRASHSFGGWLRWNNVANNIWNFAFGFSLSGFTSGSGILHTQNAGSGTLDFVRQDTLGFNDKVTASVGYANTTDWVHLALVYDAPNTDIIAYVNGVSQGTVNSATTRCSNSTSSYLSIGPGVLDAVDVFLFSRILTADEIFRLSRTRGLPINRSSLTVWVPGNDPASLTAAGQDFSGNNIDMAAVGANASLSAVNPPVSLPLVNNPVLFLPPPVVSITSAGTTNATGAASITAGAGLVPTGSTQATGAASITAAASAASAGSTQATGAASITAAASAASSGATQATGAATMLAQFPADAAGSTQATGAASLTAAASAASSGSTQATGSASVTASTAVAGSGETQTTGAAAITAAASAASSGSTQSTGAATLTALFPIDAAGTTQTAGAVAFGTVLQSTGSTQATGSASLSAAAGIASSGTTRTTGVATLTSNAPVDGASAGGYRNTRRGALVYGTRRRLR